MRRTTPIQKAMALASMTAQMQPIFQPSIYGVSHCGQHWRMRLV